MSKPLWPCMPPAEAAAELFRSCLWEMKLPADAAMKATYYLFQELIDQLGPDHERKRELIHQIVANPAAPERDALERELRIGVDRARLVLERYGKPLTKKRLNDIKNEGLLTQLDMMIKKDKDGKSVRGKDGMLVFEPNVQQLAEQIAAEDKKLPRAHRSTPRGSTSVTSIDKHIRRLVKARKKRQRGRK